MSALSKAMLLVSRFNEVSAVIFEDPRCLRICMETSKWLSWVSEVWSWTDLQYDVCVVITDFDSLAQDVCCNVLNVSPSPNSSYSSFFGTSGGKEMLMSGCCLIWTCEVLFGRGDLNWEIEKHKHEQEQNQEEDKLYKLFNDFFYRFISAHWG